MRIKVSFVCILCVCVVSAALAFGAQPAWELAPPDAKILVGADVRGLRNSALTDSMTPANHAQMQTAMAQMQAAMTMLHLPGLELLDDIDTVFLASSGDQPVAKTVPVAVSKSGAPPAKTRAPFVLVLSGTFPEAHLRPLLKGTHATYKGVNVYRGTGGNGVSIAILDEHTVLIGEDKLLYRGIDRKTMGVKAQGPLVARAQELAASNDFWLVMRDPSGALQRASAKSTAPGAELFASEIEGLDLGVSARTGFNMDFTLNTKTEAGAQALTQLLMTQMQSAVNAKMDSAKAVDFWRKVKVGATGNRMEMQIALSKEELQENVRMMQEQGAGHGKMASGVSGGVAVAGVTPTQAAPAPPPKPAEPRVIKIYGLDDGVHEIKLDPLN